MASKTSNIAPWTILSRGDAIPRGLLPFPLALGISNLLAARNLNLLVFKSFPTFSNQAKSIPSNVSLSTPGVIFPGEEIIFV